LLESIVMPQPTRSRSFKFECQFNFTRNSSGELLKKSAAVQIIFLGSSIPATDRSRNPVEARPPALQVSHHHHQPPSPFRRRGSRAKKRFLLPLGPFFTEASRLQERELSSGYPRLNLRRRLQSNLRPAANIRISVDRGASTSGRFELSHVGEMKRSIDRKMAKSRLIGAAPELH